MDNNSTIVQTTFHDIHNSEPGGAISIYSTITFKITSSSFYNVSSQQDGGAIYFYKANMLLRSISFYKCYSLINNNQFGGHTIYSPRESNSNKTFEIKDSVLYQCFFSKEAPGDSVLIVFDPFKTIMHDINFSSNANGFSSSGIPGACSGDVSPGEDMELETKRVSITVSSGCRAVCLNSNKAVHEKMNIINNTCEYIAFRNGKFSNCFIFGNRDRNNQFPQVCEEQKPSFQFDKCWGDLDGIEKKNSPNDLDLRTAPPLRVVETSINVPRLKFIISFSLLMTSKGLY